jgi:hypothetical protein
VFEQIVVQLAHRPIGEGQANIRRPFLRDPHQALQLLSADLRRPTGRVRRALNTTEAGLVEFHEATVGSLFGTPNLPRGGQHTQAAPQ